CDEIMVMYAGSAVEVGPGRAVLSDPAHPYTRCLELADPAVAGRTLFLLPEQMPGLLELNRIAGCHFAPRCPNVTDECRRARPALAELRAGHRAACIRVAATAGITPSTAAVRPATTSGGEPLGDLLLRVEGLTKRYAPPPSLFSR